MLKPVDSINKFDTSYYIRSDLFDLETIKVSNSHFFMFNVKILFFPNKPRMILIFAVETKKLPV